MLHQIIKKVVKPQVLLIIISLILSCLRAYSQVDTAKLRKEIALVLKKYGLKEPLFELKIQSTNQKGGQTALVINNYNGRDVHVINGNNYGVNGDITVTSTRHLEEPDKIELLRMVNLKKKEYNITSNCIHFNIASGSNAGLIINEIEKFLIDKKFDVVKKTLYTNTIPNGIVFFHEDGCLIIGIGYL